MALSLPVPSLSSALPSALLLGWGALGAGAGVCFTLIFGPFPPCCASTPRDPVSARATAQHIIQRPFISLMSHAWVTIASGNRSQECQRPPLGFSGWECGCVPWSAALGVGSPGQRLGFGSAGPRRAGRCTNPATICTMLLHRNFVGMAAVAARRHKRPFAPVSFWAGRTKVTGLSTPPEVSAAGPSTQTFEGHDPGLVDLRRGGQSHLLSFGSVVSGCR